MTEEEAHALAVQGTRRLGLEPDAGSMAAIAAQLKILDAMAAQFVDLPLDEHLDPAAVLRL
jgi:hypothetical protein